MLHKRHIVKGVIRTLSTLMLMVAVGIPFSADAQIKKESVPADRVYGDFVVGPGKNDIVVEPGTSETVLVTVTNRMGTERVFTFEVEDFTGTNDPLQPIVLLGSERGPYSLKDYISIEAQSFSLNHDERAVVPVTITVPHDAEPGGRYGSVLVSTVSLPSDDKGTGVAPIVSRVGSLMFVTVPGEANRDGHLAEFAVKDSVMYKNGPADFSILFRNNGNIYLNPYGIITVKNMFGQTVGEMEVKPWFAMPGSLRLREIPWNSSFAFGRYTATLSLNRGYDNVIDTAEVVFYVIPVTYILVVFGGLFIVIFGTYYTLSRFEIKRK